MTSNNITRFTGKHKLSELITAHPNLLHTLSRFGIALGFGDQSIDQVCKHSGVDTAFFLLMCNVYADSGFKPSAAQISNTDMTGLLPYLLKSHKYYLEKRLPHIRQHIEHLASFLPSQGARKAFIKFFDDYCLEVKGHFAHEEKLVFPHIASLLEGGNDNRYSINDFVDNHGNLQDKLADLTQIVFKYLPATVSEDDDAVDVVLDILQVSNDLSKHANVEEDVMCPWVRQLELKAKSK